MLRLLVLRRKNCLPDIQITAIEMDEHAETSQEKPEKFTGVIQWGLGFLFWGAAICQVTPTQKILNENHARE